jgi:hypothetical protein
MASAVTYARQQRFFKKGVLIQAPGGHDALAMYAGALMWLACFVFAIAACSWTVFGVNDYLQKLGIASVDFVCKHANIEISVADS